MLLLIFLVVISLGSIMDLLHTIIDSRKRKSCIDSGKSCSECNKYRQFLPFIAILEILEFLVGGYFAYIAYNSMKQREDTFAIFL